MWELRKFKIGIEGMLSTRAGLLFTRVRFPKGGVQGDHVAFATPPHPPPQVFPVSSQVTPESVQTNMASSTRPVGREARTVESWTGKWETKRLNALNTNRRTSKQVRRPRSATVLHDKTVRKAELLHMNGVCGRCAIFP